MALAHYSKAFEVDDGQPFLHYYSVAADKSLVRKDFTRTAFWELATKAAGGLQALGMKPGDHVLHHFSENTAYDLILRLAHVMAGTIPVTFNWQADTHERLKYKMELTGSRLLLFDAPLDGQDAADLQLSFPGLVVADVAEVCADEAAPLLESGFASVPASQTRIVIFTSGTTGNPKGVNLPYTCYQCNRDSFEQFLGFEDPTKPLIACVTNPAHHTNTTAITDWCLRRPGSTLHLFARYTTAYWPTVVGVIKSAPPRAQVVAPLVSKHIDFVESLIAAGKMPVEKNELKECLSKAYLLLGSAPVGPTTVTRLQKYAGRLPVVRFGSTETCLQVMGTPPVALSEEARLSIFKSGWANQYNGAPQKGFYIGRPHPPFTEVGVVRSLDRTKPGYMKPCDESEPGLIVVKGANVMSGYVNNPEASMKAFHDGNWYGNLGDVGFFKLNPADGGKDFFWQSRDSAMLIKGGANYAYEQIAGDLHQLLADSIPTLKESADYKLAVCGLNLASEHEDDCVVTVMLLSDTAKLQEDSIKQVLLKEAKTAGLSKGSIPDHVLFDEIPSNFKGAVLVKELKAQSMLAFKGGA